MMLDTWDGQIWYPRFYDIDTILSYDNSGAIKFDVDIEMEQGYWNTSASRLWTKIRDYMHDELVEVYKDMRANGVTYENIMKYMYDEQIAKIPQTYYNKDFDIKYAPYADEYLGKAHGDGYQHMKRWLKNRFIFCDTLFDYAPAYENDKLTIRANTLDLMSLEIETYTPVYQHISFYNGQMSKEKVDGKTGTIFEGTAQTATDQEVLIYGGSNIKKISGISSMNPDSMLIGNATRLTELIATDCPLLTEINSDKANLLPNVYLNKVDLSGCPLLGGMLKISNSQLLQNLNMKGTAITGVQLPSSIRNLEVLRLPNTLSSLTLNDAPLLHTLEFDNGINLQSISLKNCNRLDNCINFDLTQTPTVVLDNSYNTEEIYMSETTNLTLKNMPSLQRVIFTPNSEYSEFDINNVINGKNYKITTFNNPMMTDFITTAPHRDSYTSEAYKEFIKGEVILKENFNANITKFIDTLDFKPKSVEIKIDLSTCTGANENILSIGDSIENWDGTHCHFYYTKSSSQLLAYFNTSSLGSVGTTPKTFTLSSTILEIILNEEGLLINGVLQEGSHPISVYPSMSIGSQEGNVRSNATYLYIKAHKKEEWVNTMNITPNTVFTANTLDLADTQFQNVKFLCTTDIYNLKVPTSMKNFYCDSAMDIDTDVIEDASYEVIHEELIEPYTTNYEGEVTRLSFEYEEISYIINEMDLPGMTPNSNTGEIETYATYNATNFLKVQGGTEYTILSRDISEAVYIYCYDKDYKYLGKSFGEISMGVSTNTISRTIPVGTEYIRISARNLLTTFTIGGIFGTNYTPNIIPSSANGSLIFNMYSNNTTQPTSTSPYMWDLTGLKLEDFYTYGMNNWVKGIYSQQLLAQYTLNSSKPSSGDVAFDDNLRLEFECATNSIPNSNPWIYIYCRYKNNNRHFYFKPDGFAFVVNSNWTIETKAPYEQNNILHKFVFELFNDVLNVYMDNTIIYTSPIENVPVYNSTQGNNQYGISYKGTTDLTVNSVDNDIKLKSITMPQRMSGYSVRLVNADITPNEYPTMLYPKLIDTMLPITGKLDYTAYNGTSLAWAYAYTTDDVDINPLGSREQGKITQDYNKLYSTDFVDIVDVWIYKDTDVSKLSTNEAITKAYIELTNDNYTTRVDEVLQWYPNCTDLYFFSDESNQLLASMFSNNNSSYKAQIINITFINEFKTNDIAYAFNGLSNVKTINGLSNTIKYINGAFQNCSSLNQQFDFSSCSIISGRLSYVFKGCTSLTIPPILPSNYTGGIQQCFQNCTSLTEAPVIPNGVTEMQNCFQGCTSLTTVPNIPSSCTNFIACFNQCTNLTSVPTDGWKGELDECFRMCTLLNQQINIDNATDLYGMFEGCTSLTIIPTISSATNCRMQNCFKNCTSLTTPPNIPDGVTDMQSCFRDCKSLTQAPTIPDSVTNMNSCFEGCSSLKEAPYISENVTQADALYRNCTSLTKAVLPIGNATCYLSLAGANNVTDIIFVGLRTTDYNMSWITDSFASSVICSNIQKLVPEHLADLASEGKTATLTLGETYGAYLTPDEVFSANQKGWTIVGASSDFTIVNASDDVSGYTTDENVLSCFIELTNANYLTRIDEVLQWYPNCTDLYLFEDGSVTTLNSMFGTSGTSENCTYKAQIVTITFVDGYFQNTTNAGNLARRMPSLTTVNNIPNGVVTGGYMFEGSSKLTTITNLPNTLETMESAFSNCTSLVAIPNTPSSLRYSREMFNGCSSFNQQLDWSKLNLTDANALNGTFYGCKSLTYTPILPSNYTGSMQSCFQNCSSLTEAPTIPSGVTNMGSTFRECSLLTQAPVIPQGVTNMSSTFQGCTALTQAPVIPQGVTNMYGCFQSCSALTTPPIIPEGVASMYYTFAFSGITTPPNIPSTATTIEGVCRQCTSLTTMTIPFRSTITNYWMCIHNSPITDITWEGEVESSLDISRLDSVYQRTQADIQELVPEHLGDLYKDKAIFDFSKKEITINNTKTTLE